MNVFERLFLLLLTMFSVTMVSCKEDDDIIPDDDDTEDCLMGKWYRISDFDGVPRSDVASFTIGDYGYLVCGFDGTSRLSDFWEYDMDRDTWTQKANFPGAARNSGVAMAVDGKGYFGTGYDGSNKLDDFWEYDPAANSWTQRADFPGGARYDAVAFGVDGKGYVGCGYDGSFLKDFYVFDPDTDSWEQLYFDGSKRSGASAFVIDDKAYICCGLNNGVYADDFWRFDPSTGIWTQLRNISDPSEESYDDEYAIARVSAATFVIDGSAYLTCGESGSLCTDTWKYSPSTDLWENVAKFKGVSRKAQASFSNGKRGFVLAGMSGLIRFDDVWEFHPDEYDKDDY